jgi:hypothetical protein
MKKVETEAVKKLKLEDYEIGRTLGRGNFLFDHRWIRQS